MTGFITFVFVSIVLIAVVAVTVNICRKDVSFYRLTTVQMSSNLVDNGGVEDFCNCNSQIFSAKNEARKAYQDKVNVYETQLDANRLKYDTACGNTAFPDVKNLIEGQRFITKYYCDTNANVVTKIVTFAIILDTVNTR